ncbi:MAG: hypothetical protein RBR86_08205 [Pseudobdellovibrionaceae bacterium]|jgi:hypothetical protein|nr:hypothetical protein [Pseudobdellovibrionaceae bacterium]
MTVKTPYVPHIFGDDVKKKLSGSIGWLTAGVASSIPWPSYDVCISYDGKEYFLRGTEEAKDSPYPCITVTYDADNVNEALEKVYRLTSVLSWFLDGYVDVSIYSIASHPIRCGSRHVYSSMGISGSKSFNCNHLPIIENENARIALAFWREGQRLENEHEGYSFLSFFKVIESQFNDTKRRADWISANIDELSEKAKDRVDTLRGEGIDVSKHLFESCRCAIAHASLNGVIIDPDIAQDKRRLSQDLVIIKGLARLYISRELNIPTSRSLYTTRNRLEPWNHFLATGIPSALQSGEGTIDDLTPLTRQIVSIGLWPDGTILGLERMTAHIQSLSDGKAIITFVNYKETILLTFLFDYKTGKAEPLLENCGLATDKEINEDDVRALATFYYKTFANGAIELRIEGTEPIECDAYIPVNMMMRVSAEQAIEDEVQKFREQANNSSLGV